GPTWRLRDAPLADADVEGNDHEECAQDERHRDVADDERVGPDRDRCDGDDRHEAERLFEVDVPAERLVVGNRHGRPVLLLGNGEYSGPRRRASTTRKPRKTLMGRTLASPPHQHVPATVGRDQPFDGIFRTWPGWIMSGSLIWSLLASQISCQVSPPPWCAAI